MKTKKKLVAVIISVLAVIALTCGLVACDGSEPADNISESGSTDETSTVETETVGELDYMKQGDGYAVIGIGTFKDSELVIPSEYNGLPVTAIEDTAFYLCMSLTEVTIPDSVTYIGAYAFNYCKYLKSINVPQSVNSIGDYAFANCVSLETIYYDAVSLSSNYTYKSNVFYNSGSTDNGAIVTIGTNVAKIPDYVFYLSNITGISFENGCKCTTIGDYAFGGCHSLSDMEISDSVTTIEEAAFWQCTSITSVVLTDNVTSMGASVFQECDSLTTVKLGNGLTSISQAAFHSCVSLESITIPSSVTSIGDSAFENCTSLLSIYYLGTPKEWSEVYVSWVDFNGLENEYYLSETTIYCYSETEPEDDGDFWHYVDGEIVVWSKN